jgi:predicted AAA+ superfamily ATPase
MIGRFLHDKLRRVAMSYPVVAVTGPRQAGKTTLVRATFPDHAYVSLEDPDAFEQAGEDPRRFLAGVREGVILDEVQKLPTLLSYLQTDVDLDDRPGRFVLTGSSNLLLLRAITQSLAGRVSLQTLLPFSLAELQAAGREPASLEQMLFEGFFPRIHDRHLDPQEWLHDYVSTFVERDVRQVLNVGDLASFRRFLRLCAARSGQLLNLSALGADAGVTHNTAKAWLSVLEATYLVALLPPWHANLGKRLVKSPKLYLLDPGLLVTLLGIRSPDALQTHAQRGAIFESWVVSEALKAAWNQGRPPEAHFFRTQTGHEVDLLLGDDARLAPIEIKSGTTVASDWFDGLTAWERLTGAEPGRGVVLYGGEETREWRGGTAIGWRGAARVVSSPE